MSKLPPFKFAQKGFQLLKPEPIKIPHAEALAGADDETIELMLSLLSCIEALGDHAKIERAADRLSGVLIALSDKAWVLWHERNRVLWWISSSAIRGRVWPVSHYRRSPLLRPPPLELGSEWTLERFEDGFMCQCDLSPSIMKMKSPEGQRFVDRYIRQIAPPKPIKGKATSDDDGGMLSHSLRPRTEEFAP